MSWKNYADEIYTKLAGKEVYEEKLKTQFKAPVQWFPTTDLVVRANSLRALIATGALALRRRLPHWAGVGLKGEAEVVQTTDMKDAFFTPGKKFDVKARFSPSEDCDLTLGVKAMAIELVEPSTGDVLNFITLTGEYALFPNLDVFLQFAKTKRSDELFKSWALSAPHVLRALISAYRRDVESFTDQRYYGQMTYEYQPAGGVKKLARFRILPTDGRPQTGRISREQQERIWERGPLPEETKSSCYLREELHERVAREEIHFTLQVQFHAMDDNSRDEIYNPSILWSDVTSPWSDVMVLTLTAPLTADETRRLTFNIHNLPTCLKFKPAYSRYSFNSIPYVRGMVYPISQWIRKWFDG